MSKFRVVRTGGFLHPAAVWEAIKVRSSSKLNSGGSGSKGVSPPMLKSPPYFAPEGERNEREEEEEKINEVGEVANERGDTSSTCSSWDLLRNSIPNVRLKPVITPGSWQKGELLGRGSFGTVYEGISQDGFFFAVKQVSLLDQGSQGKQSVVQLEHEIALLSQFEHENIVRYIGTEMDESNLYIFIESVTNGFLLSLYRRYKLTDSQVSAYTRQILHGLKYLHDRNIVHRDIKCANILVDANGSVKVANFGLAKEIKLNGVQSIEGTSFWMAPEVLRGRVKGYGLPADIWSLGCTVLEMLTGKIPYSPMDCISAMYRIGRGELPPVPDTLSRDASDFILLCLKVNPDDRPTAAQLLDHKFVQRSFSQSSGSASPHSSPMLKSPAYFTPEGERNEREDEEEKINEVGEVANEIGDTSSTCSSWDLLRNSISSSTCSSWEVIEVTNQREDSRSNSISPNVRLKPVITPGSWEKGELLGRGSFGTVYEGISEDGFFFAVKQVSLLDQDSQGKQSAIQLEHEITLLSQFEHENIVRYIGTEMDESNLYIFIEFVTKGSLLSLYRRYKLRDSQVSAYTRQILHGLKYLHDRNIVHRDIKCANILVDANGSVKVADFGLAKAIKLNDVKSCQGTAFWMAPEVVRGKVKGYGLSADIWSLGCTVLEMLTRKFPYSPMEPISAMFRIGKGELPPVPDTISRDARDFILQCLKVNPDDRPTAVQLLDHKFVQRSFSQSSGSVSPHIPRRG